MAPAVRQVARIFEDADAAANGALPPPKKRFHSRVPSVGDVLRGRKRETSPTKSQTRITTNTSPSPLGERHINSPPNPKRVPLKDADEPPRRPLHKKTGSSVSLKDLILGREKEKTSTSDGDSVSSAEMQMKKPKKTKSSTNLSGFLKMNRSKKDLNEGMVRDKENTSPSNAAPGTNATTPPIWSQFMAQPLQEAGSAPRSQPDQKLSIEDEIKLYTPRDYSEYRPSEQRNFHDLGQPFDYKPPQRPFLEHRSSRESIFKEHLEDETKSDKLSNSEQQAADIVTSTITETCALKSSSEKEKSNDGIHPQQSRPVSRVFDMLPSLKMPSRSSKHASVGSIIRNEEALSPEELDSAFEKVLDSLNIPFNMRDNMRRLTPGVKAGLMRGDRCGSGSSNLSIPTDNNDVRASARTMEREDETRTKTSDGDKKDSKKSLSRSRPRSRILTISKRDDSSPTKQDQQDTSTRARSKSRPKSVDLSNIRSSSRSRPTPVALSKTPTNGSDVATMPGDFIHYLREVQKPEIVEVGKIHKLRLLLRNESVSWTDSFIAQGGMDELVQLLYRIMKIEWREEHEDSLLHEDLLCLKALCTTSLALNRLDRMADKLFPALLGMLFDPERKGPSEFGTRAVIVSLLFAHLLSAVHDGVASLETRARRILGYLMDIAPEDGKKPLEFVSQMHVPRPYRTWSKEVVNVTKEVFWIFLHHLNVIPIVEINTESTSFSEAHFPPPRPPHPAAPYVGGVEWEATQYLANHLDLLNGLIASLPDQQSRNLLREDLRQSGWEKVMGHTLRTCKEKFYGGVHDGLKVWVSAARADGWAVEDVRAGPPREATAPRSPAKKKTDEAPKIALDVGLGMSSRMDDGWV